MVLFGVKTDSGSTNKDWGETLSGIFPGKYWFIKKEVFQGNPDVFIKLEGIANGFAPGLSRLLISVAGKLHAQHDGLRSDSSGIHWRGLGHLWKPGLAAFQCLAP